MVVLMAVDVQRQATADVRHPATADTPPRVTSEADIRLRVTEVVAEPRTAVVAVRMAAVRTAVPVADMGGKIALVCFPA